jgi:isoquinoline 1-oxidoreductase alpha subunit
MRLLPERDDHGRRLGEKPQPSDADIDAAITNICRCGTYARIRATIHTAATASG